MEMLTFSPERLREDMEMPTISSEQLPGRYGNADL
jgi:hypothetical protein